MAGLNMRERISKPEEKFLKINKNLVLLSKFVLFLRRDQRLTSVSVSRSLDYASDPGALACNRALTLLGIQG